MAYRRRAEIRAWLEAHERHPLVRPLFVVGRPLHRLAVRPVVRVLAPEVRFLMDRLTLKLVTAMAVAGTGIYVFVLYVMVRVGPTALTPFDRELFDVGRHLRTDLAVDVAKAVTELGSFASVTALLVGGRRGRWWRATGRLDAALLVLGFALVYLAVDVTKDAVDRVRPAGPLVDTSESSFPSGHAAYATAWIAVAVALTRERGLPSQAAIVTGAIVLTAAIGLTRVYLRAHYWSDVAAGWALGAGDLRPAGHDRADRRGRSQQ